MMSNLQKAIAKAVENGVKYEIIVGFIDTVESDSALLDSIENKSAESIFDLLYLYELLPAGMCIHFVKVMGNKHYSREQIKFVRDLAFNHKIYGYIQSNITCEDDIVFDMRVNQIIAFLFALSNAAHNHSSFNSDPFTGLDSPLFYIYEKMDQIGFFRENISLRKVYFTLIDEIYTILVSNQNNIDLRSIDLVIKLAYKDAIKELEKNDDDEDEYI